MSAGNKRRKFEFNQMMLLKPNESTVDPDFLWQKMSHTEQADHLSMQFSDIKSSHFAASTTSFPHVQLVCEDLDE